MRMAPVPLARHLHGLYVLTDSTLVDRRDCNSCGQHERCYLLTNPASESLCTERVLAAYLDLRTDRRERHRVDRVGRGVRLDRPLGSTG